MKRMIIGCLAMNWLDALMYLSVTKLTLYGAWINAYYRDMQGIP